MPPLASSADRRVRVLVNGYGAVHGGIVRVHNAICRELVAMGYDVSVANAPRDQAVIEGLEVLSRQTTTRARSMLSDIWRSLPMQTFDLRIDTAPAFRLFTWSRRHVVVVHDLNFLDPTTHEISWKQLAYRRLLHSWTLRRVDAIVVNSESTRQEVETFRHGAGQKARVLPLPADLPIDGRRWARVDRGDGAIVVLSFGHARNKGVDRVLRVMVEHPEVHLRVVAPMMGWESFWEPLAIELGVRDRITVLEGLTDEELVGEYLACDVFCMLSTYEGYGLPVVEALSLGVPTVISALPVLTTTSLGFAEVADAPDPEADFDVIERALHKKRDHWSAAAEAFARPTWRDWTADMVRASGG